MQYRRPVSILISCCLCYVYNIISFYYNNLNKVAAGWREIARELEVSGKKTHHLWLLLAVPVKETRKHRNKNCVFVI